MADTDTLAPVDLETLQDMHLRGEKIACLTCYDASFTQLLESAGVDLFIIGDSLGMVLLGHASTVPVTMDDMGSWTCRMAAMPVPGRHWPMPVA
jgi:3-methyl-2-oxobutanoate hydroxymethyltransferase